MRLPYGVGAYRRTTGRLPDIRLVNMFVERTPANLKEGVALLSRPGLVLRSTLGRGPVSGVFQQPGTLDGDLFSVSGGFLYRDEAKIGAVSGGGRVRFAASATEIIMARGASLYRSGGVDVATVSFPDDASVTDVAFLNGLFIAARADSQKYYWSAVLDGTTWDALDFASAERKPDNIVAIAVRGDELWLFGSESTEVHVPTGDADAPFAPIDGRLYERGCIARDTVVSLDNTLFWVGDDGIAYRASEVPERVSDNSIEERIAATDADDLRAWAFTFEGHVFYVLTTAEGTFAYDASTREWCEFQSYGMTGWRCHVGCMAGTTVIAGDSETGDLWRLDAETYADGDDPMQRIFTAGIEDGGIVCDNLLLDCSVGQTALLSGQGSAPVVEMRFSRDLGNTWSGYKARTVGAQGKYRARVAWLAQGLIDYPGRVFEFRMTDPVPWRVSGLSMNEMQGGLSR